MKQSTNKELPELLEARNEGGKYDKLIADAKSGRYHDYKNPDDVICGKMELVKDLQPYPELGDILRLVVEGEFDEEADEEDKAQLRLDTPRSMWGVLGLE